MAYACYPYVLDKLKGDNTDYGHGMLNSISSKALKQRIKREERLQKKAKAVFFMGNWVVKLMKEKYPQMSEKFIYAGGGLNSDFVINNVEKTDDGIKRILFVGIDFKRKGGELLVNAFKQLREKYDDKIELVIAGPNIIKNENGINYIGRLNRDELSKWFSKCDIYCMPSRFEAYGLVFIEALCYGLPIVAYKDFEMVYFVENDSNGCLIDKYESEELSIALDRTLFNKTIKNKTVNMKKHYKEYYSWSSTVNRMMNYMR